MVDKKRPTMLVFDQLSYAKPFESMFDIIYTDSRDKLIREMKHANVVMFTGGSDVSPHLYGEPVGKRTSHYMARDKFEQFVYQMATTFRVPMLGICRGLQFLHVMNGGKLVQDTSNHAGANHEIQDIFNNTVLISSSHHQMVRPDTTPKAFVVACSKENRSQYYLDGWDKEIYKVPQAVEKNLVFREPEIMCYPDTNCLGIQGHPEYLESKALHDYCCDLVKYFLLKDKTTQPKYHNPIIN